MKKVELNDERISEVASIVFEQEHKLNVEEKIYLMTWSPDPKQLPDCDFINQHIYLVPYVQSYLSFCSAGLACVESTQIGNPHYHLWYQVTDDIREQGRIRWIKVMQKIGNIKINSGVRHFKINNWNKHHNALHYYKEDSVGQQLNTPYNPIYKDMLLPEIDYSDYTFFFQHGKTTARKIIEKVSQIKDLENFYKKSI